MRNVLLMRKDGELEFDEWKYDRGNGGIQVTRDYTTEQKWPGGVEKCVHAVETLELQGTGQQVQCRTFIVERDGAILSVYKTRTLIR